MGNSAQVNLLFISADYSRRQATGDNAIVAQLVEHNLPKVGVASSSLVYRSQIITIIMERKKLKPWRLITAKKEQKVVTRDGREVLTWEVVGDPKESLWVTKVTVKDAADKRKRVTYMVNHNGRRYANIQSADDILVEVVVSVSDPSDTGCMPDPMRAIRAIREGDIGSVRLANKVSGTWNRRDGSDSYYIGSNDE